MALPAIIMLDTNIASYIIRDQHSKAIAAHMQTVPLNRLCISSISEAELRYGIALNPGATKLAKAVGSFLQRIESLPWDSAVAECYANVRAQLKKRGTPLANLDMLIAAHALSMSALLVTNDNAFRHIKGLKTADWTKP